MQMSVHKSREPTATERHIVNNRATIIMSMCSGNRLEPVFQVRAWQEQFSLHEFKLFVSLEIINCVSALVLCSRSMSQCWDAIGDNIFPCRVSAQAELV